MIKNLLLLLKFLKKSYKMYKIPLILSGLDGTSSPLKGSTTAPSEANGKLYLCFLKTINVPPELTIDGNPSGSNTCQYLFPLCISQPMLRTKTTGTTGKI